MTNTSSMTAQEAGAYLLDVLGDPALVAAAVTIVARDKIAGPMPVFFSPGDQPAYDNAVNLLGISGWGVAGDFKAWLATRPGTDVLLPESAAEQAKIVKNAIRPTNRGVLMARNFRRPLNVNIVRHCVVCRDAQPHRWDVKGETLIAAAQAMLDAWVAQGWPEPSVTKPGFMAWSLTVLGAMEAAALDVGFVTRKVS